MIKFSKKNREIRPLKNVILFRPPILGGTPHFWGVPPVFGVKNHHFWGSGPIFGVRTPLFGGLPPLFGFGGWKWSKISKNVTEDQIFSSNDSFFCVKH